MDVRRAGKHAAQRMTTGYVLPIEPTQRKPLPKWVWCLPAFVVCGWIVAHEQQLETNPYGQALWLAGMAGVAVMILGPMLAVMFYIVPTFTIQTAIPASKAAALSVSDKLHELGWPTWKDAWGYKGHRPGGWGRGTLRGYLRFYAYGMVPFCVIGMFMGGDAIAGSVVFLLLFGVPALLAAGWLYQFRCTDFDPMKGLAFSAAFYVFLCMVLPGRSEGLGQRSFTPSFTQPGGPKPPWM